MHTHPLESIIDAAFERRADITPANVEAPVAEAIEQVIAELDAGRLRVAEKRDGAPPPHMRHGPPRKRLGHA